MYAEYKTAHILMSEDSSHESLLQMYSAKDNFRNFSENCHRSESSL